MAALMQLYPKAVQPLETGAPSPHTLMQDMTRFFLSFELAYGGQDLYSRFLVALLQSPNGMAVHLATLNYEHLLERAMGRLGLRPAVLRPHGGCQLWPEKGGTILVGRGRAIGHGMHSISSRVKAKHALRISQLLNQVDQMKYPCMAMYLPGKITQVGQRYLRRMQARFQRRVTDSRTIILIGVRPWDSDTHLWPAIYTAQGTVLFVGSRGDCDVLASRRGHGRRTLFVSDSFEEAISVLPGEM